MSLLSSWKESTPNTDNIGNNRVKTPMTEDESLKPKNVEIKKLEESLMEDIEIKEDDARESKGLD